MEEIANYNKLLKLNNNLKGFIFEYLNFEEIISLFQIKKFFIICYRNQISHHSNQLKVILEEYCQYKNNPHKYLSQFFKDKQIQRSITSSSNSKFKTTLTEILCGIYLKRFTTNIKKLDISDKHWSKQSYELFTIFLCFNKNIQEIILNFKNYDHTKFLELLKIIRGNKNIKVLKLHYENKEELIFNAEEESITIIGTAKLNYAAIFFEVFAPLTKTFDISQINLIYSIVEFYDILQLFNYYSKNNGASKPWNLIFKIDSTFEESSDYCYIFNGINLNKVYLSIHWMKDFDSMYSILSYLNLRDIYLTLSPEVFNKNMKMNYLLNEGISKSLVQNTSITCVTLKNFYFSTETMKYFLSNKEQLEKLKIIYPLTTNEFNAIFDKLLYKEFIRKISIKDCSDLSDTCGLKIPLFIESCKNLEKISLFNHRFCAEAIEQIAKGLIKNYHHIKIFKFISLIENYNTKVNKIFMNIARENGLKEEELISFKNKLVFYNNKIFK